MMALGFPRGLAANPAGFPILRSGRWPPIRWPSAAFPTFLLDFSVFPGNSGGPVFMSQAARRRAAPPRAKDVQFIAGILTQQVELSGERLEIGIVTHAVHPRDHRAARQTIGRDPGHALADQGGADHARRRAGRRGDLGHGHGVFALETQEP
jgi:hypothetical protein